MQEERQSMVELVVGEDLKVYKRPLKKPVVIEGDVVKAMLGGKWPEFHGFAFDAVPFWHVTSYGTLTPMDGEDKDSIPIPGPDFKLVMVDDWPF